MGDQAISGYYNDETTGALIERIISDCLFKTDCPDLVGEFIPVEKSNSADQKWQKIPEKIKVPFLGELSIKNLSLPILTVIIAGIDGFNPCAMWVLVFLISFLIGVKDKKRRWILGSVFIAASAVVYFLFMSAWLNLFLFLGFVFWVRIVIGLVALISGGYSLREFFVNKEAVCKIASGETKQKLFKKLKDVVEKRRLLLALIGIIAIAFAVNLIELACSAGLPAVYTQILTLSRLFQWQYYLYLLFYIFIFMLDDLIVFFAAMLTLQLVGAATKYTRISRLIGGIILLIVGLLLILRPEFLMFG
jgi:MFS family permease